MMRYMGPVNSQQTFIRHPVPKGMVESICNRCLLTVGRSRDESDLERLESRHECKAKQNEIDGEKTGSER